MNCNVVIYSVEHSSYFIQIRRVEHEDTPGVGVIDGDCFDMKEDITKLKANEKYKKSDQ